MPQYSRSQVDKAGELLSNPQISDSDKSKSLSVLNNWRSCHGYPVNTFQATLRSKLKTLGFKEVIVAQRLKRLPTMLEKLQRFPEMNLSTMQDIAGIRVILKNMKSVNKLVQEYDSGMRFAHELIRKDDYIKMPKDDGYRSVHLVYKYKNNLKPQYNGLRIEFQVRTKLQHVWATAVETMSTILGQSFKSGKGEEKWREFFILASAVFAYKERMPSIQKYEHMSESDIIQALANLEDELKALDKMEGYDFALKLVQDQNKTKKYYHLILLDFKKKIVRSWSYAKKNISEANKHYAAIEAKLRPGQDVVLVSTQSIRTLKQAFPNYFLNVNDFIKELKSSMIVVPGK